MAGWAEGKLTPRCWQEEVYSFESFDYAKFQRPSPHPFSWVIRLGVREFFRSH
jgi:hypothetical protein